MYSQCTPEADKATSPNFITLTGRHQQFHKGGKLCSSPSKQISRVSGGSLPLPRWFCVCDDYKDIGEVCWQAECEEQHGVGTITGRFNTCYHKSRSRLISAPRGANRQLSMDSNYGPDH